jgi:hypothetical protein
VFGSPCLRKKEGKEFLSSAAGKTSSSKNKIKKEFRHKAVAPNNVQAGKEYVVQVGSLLC